MKADTNLREALEPYPFCGSSAAMSVLLDDDNEPDGDIISAWVACPCGVEMHESRTEAEAAMRWNARAALASEPVVGTDPTCAENAQVPPAPAGRETIAEIIAAVIQREGVTHSSVRKAADAILAAGPAVTPQGRGVLSRKTVEKALCCPGGCVRADDCFVDGPPTRWGRSKHEREQADAVLALIATPSAPHANTGETGK